MNLNHRSIAYFWLRLTVGCVFFVAGMTKMITGVSTFAEGLEKQFASTILPASAVSLFGMTLPYIEMLIGFLLIFGLFTRLGVALAGGLMVALTMGLALVGEHETVAHNLIYALILFGLSYYVEHNQVALDSLFTRHKKVVVEERRFEYRKTA